MAVVRTQDRPGPAARRSLCRSRAWRTVPREILVVALGVAIYFGCAGH
jgi:hypothetical protein